MAKLARSARGEPVNFELLAIKKQLASTPTPVSVNQRRKFIDEKDGVRTRENYIVPPPAPSAVGALALAQAAADASATAAEAATALVSKD